MENIGENKWFILSIDGKETIYGPSPETRETAFYTDDPIHINFLENYIWHDILVNRLVKRMKKMPRNGFQVKETVFSPYKI